MFQLLTSVTDDQDVREIRLLNPEAIGTPVQSLGLSGELLILSIGRGEELIIPHGNTRLEPGDRLTILGDKEALAETAIWLEKGK
jgi:Trk K+ transport system NAD-binding subunit